MQITMKLEFDIPDEVKAEAEAAGVDPQEFGSNGLTNVLQILALVGLSPTVSSVEVAE